MIAARQILVIKPEEDKKDRYKARCVTGGHKDIMKDYLVLGAQTVQSVSVRIFLEIAKVKGFRIWAVDFKLTYRQSDQLLIRKTFNKNLTPEFKHSPEEELQLLKSIYTLAEFGDQWLKILRWSHINWSGNDTNNNRPLTMLKIWGKRASRVDWKLCRRPASHRYQWMTDKIRCNLGKARNHRKLTTTIHLCRDAYHRQGRHVPYWPRPLHAQNRTDS